MTRGSLLLPAEYRPGRWKNGQGISRDIATEPASATWDDLLWRISVADIEGDCDFSYFPGLDRAFVAFEGGGVVLRRWESKATIADAVRQICLFPGEWRIQCSLKGGPARALNVFTRRGKAHHRIRLLNENEQIHTVGPNFIFAFDDGCHIENEAMPKGACLRFDIDADIDYRAGTGNAAALIAITEETRA